MQKTTFSVLSTIAIAITLLGLPAVAQDSPLQPFVFYNPGALICLEPQGDSMLEGTPILQQACAPTPAQEWLYVSLGSAGFHFQNALTGMCLDARGGAANHTPIQQWPCNSISNETWQVIAPAKGSLVAPVQSSVAGSKGFCLDIQGGKPMIGFGVQIYQCNQTPAQQWQLKPDPNVYIPSVGNAVTTCPYYTTARSILYGLVPNVTETNACYKTNLPGSNGQACLQEPSPGSFGPYKSIDITEYLCR